MLKKILNEARITFYIKATGPILIKDGETDQEREERKQIEEKEKGKGTSPDMRFVVDANEKIFIPGSSLRGVWRSWCEKIARTISRDVPLACDPFDNSKGSNISCSEWLKEKKASASEVYKLSCPICKLFGNTSQASRLRISDAYIEGAHVDRADLPVRDGIGIDRFTGGVSSGPFKYQYLIGKTFKTEVQLRNFELWQLGLLGYLFRDFKEELVPIGFGKTRGLGKVQGTVEGAEITFYGLKMPEIDEETKKAQISGIGTLYSDADKGNYRFAEERSLEIEFTSASKSAIKASIKLNRGQADTLFTKTADYWASVKADSTPQGYFLAAQINRDETVKGKEDV